MKIIFLGTKGYIEESSKYHKWHTSTFISYKKSRLLIDCGIDWLKKHEKLKALKPDAILITHAHPDHSWGLQNGTFAPVYASKTTWNLIDHFKIPHEFRNIVKSETSFNIKDFKIKMFDVEHSIRCPANSYKISAGEKTIFYSGDILYLKNYKKILKDTNLYIGDGATIKRSLVRKKDGKIFGHASINTQLTWCQKSGIKNAVFTHFGKELVEKTLILQRNILKELGIKKGIKVIVAYDGLQVYL